MVTMEDTERYWRGNKRLRDAAIRAHETGKSLDEIYLETLRSFSATSRGSLSHLPKSKKSRVMPKRSVSK